jgi:hypothetical protein
VGRGADMDFGIYGGSVEADGWGLHVRAELNGKKIDLARLVGLDPPTSRGWPWNKPARLHSLPVRCCLNVLLKYPYRLV